MRGTVQIAVTFELDTNGMLNVSALDKQTGRATTAQVHLVGLENDSPKCVPPTALCSYKVAVRIRDNQNKVVHSASTTASATAERCSDLCEKAINHAVVKVVETAVSVLKNGADVDASAPDLSATGEADQSSGSL